MWTSKTSAVLGFIGVVFFGLLIFLFLKVPDSTFYFEKNTWALKTDQNQLILPTQSSEEGYLVSKLWPHEFRSISKVYLDEIEVGKTLFLSNKLKIHRASTALSLIEIENTRWFIFDENFEEFPSDSPISSESDFWIINPKSKVPTNLKPPAASIIELSNRPSKKALKNFTQSSKTQVISTNNHDEIKIRWHENDWEIQTISYEEKNR